MIKPINIKTTDVAKELKRIAAQNSTSPSKLFIEINSVNTFVKEAESEFIEIFGNDFERFTDEEILRDSNVVFEQEYEIDVKSRYQGYPFEEMICEIEFKNHDTLAYLVIKKGSKLKYYDGLYDDFLDFIDEQKLRSNIMLYLFDAEYESSIKEFVDVIQKIKTITFKDDKKILISQGIDEIESVNADICMTIEENNKIGAEDENGKVDYANRGFLLSCVEGEELFEFIKPQQGKNGRTCRGDIIEAEIVNLDAKPTFTVEDGIEVQDSFENIKYLSNKSGYLVKNANSYEVSNSIDVGEISFKTTGTINSDLDSEISINVIKENPLEDAVEEGMHVKVQKLNIQGSVGPNTKIEAREISITGQSHNDSSIQCVNAYISQHKGKIVGRKVEVDTLDGGEIIADTAIIQNAMRGKIKAKNIEIKVLGRHVIMEASESIEVKRIKGEENKFIIDASISGAFDNSKNDDDTAYLTKLEDELKILTETFKSSAKKIKESLQQCEKIKAAIIKSKEQSLEISPNLIKNFKICKVMKVRYKKSKEDVEYKNTQIEKLKKKLSLNQHNIMDSRIVVKEPLNGYNHITYILHNPQREIKLTTNESMRKEIFKLIEDDEGILKIINTD